MLGNLKSEGKNPREYLPHNTEAKHENKFSFIPNQDNAN